MTDKEESITQARVRLYREVLGLPPINAETNRAGTKTDDRDRADENANGQSAEDSP